MREPTPSPDLRLSTDITVSLFQPCPDRPQASERYQPGSRLALSSLQTPSAPNRRNQATGPYPSSIQPTIRQDDPVPPLPVRAHPSFERGEMGAVHWGLYPRVLPGSADCVSLLHSSFLPSSERVYPAGSESRRWPGWGETRCSPPPPLSSAITAGSSHPGGSHGSVDTSLRVLY